MVCEKKTKPCTKLRYLSKEEAEGDLKRLNAKYPNNKLIEAHWCVACKSWHLSTWTKAKKGRVQKVQKDRIKLNNMRAEVKKEVDRFFEI
jgi:thiol:disulfide interchange protein